jgi:aminodeoxyfutalosine synthase
MTTSISFDLLMERVTGGARLSADDIRELATAPDILSIGMLADAVRRRLHDTRATFLRMIECAADTIAETPIPAKVQEIRITGAPATLSDAADAIARAQSTGRSVTAFTWPDVERWAGGHAVAPVLGRLRDAGLEGLAALPLDGLSDADAVVEQLATAGYGQLRLTIDKAPASDRTGLFLRAAELQDRFSCIRVLSPLPMTLNAFKPTTGYEDVKMVAMARLAAPNIPTIQVDWRRYGPKLAQVALSFGADDIDGISGSDEAPEGRRRAPLEEIHRNIEAAGFQPVERDGRFTRVG